MSNPQFHPSRYGDPAAATLREARQHELNPAEWLADRIFIRPTKTAGALFILSLLGAILGIVLYPALAEGSFIRDAVLVFLKSLVAIGVLSIFGAILISDRDTRLTQESAKLKAETKSELTDWLRTHYGLLLSSAYIHGGTSDDPSGLQEDLLVDSILEYSSLRFRELELVDTAGRALTGHLVEVAPSTYELYRSGLDAGLENTRFQVLSSEA